MSSKVQRIMCTRREGGPWLVPLGNGKAIQWSFRELTRNTGEALPPPLCCLIQAVVVVDAVEVPLWIIGLLALVRTGFHEVATLDGDSLSS